MLRIIAPLGFALAASVGHAASFTPPKGCQLQATVQNRGCSVQDQSRRFGWMCQASLMTALQVAMAIMATEAGSTPMRSAESMTKGQRAGGRWTGPSFGIPMSSLANRSM